MEIEHAIANRLQVEFSYDGHYRLVLPGAYGLHATTHRPTLRGYQVGGGSSSRTPPFWSLFSLDRISDFVVSEIRFEENPPDFTPGDKHLNPIIIELTTS